jgi:hypothetical protein
LDLHYSVDYFLKVNITWQKIILLFGF